MKRKGEGGMSVDDIMVDLGHAKFSDKESIDIPNSTFKGNFRGEMELIEVYMINEDNSECPSCAEKNTKSAVMLTNLGRIFACKSCKLFSLERFDETVFKRTENEEDKETKKNERI
tara:strand:- start:41 stop:388 length:348 start_codon:yes stop_codon:yes gene_type:complete